jgi:uncharacterized protein
MSVFVDSSAFYAMLDINDEFCNIAKKRWPTLLASQEGAITSNYVVLETSAILQNRFGMKALQEFHEIFLPVVTVHWVDDQIQRSALAMLLILGRRSLSLVDCTSFEIMRSLGIREAFTFDKHFKEFGFKIYT